MLYTEFIASDDVVLNIARSLRKMTLFEIERPIGIQLYGHNIGAMTEAAKAATELKPNLIDINFGCPAKKIARRGAGSGMMCNVPKMVEMTQSIVQATHLPVTVKTRLGYDTQTKNIVEIAERLQDVGIHALTVHGRTRDQFFKGEADWTLIGDIKNNPRMHIPIIGNGDVTSASKAKLMFDRYGVDGIMIGRGSIGKPWIFKQIRHLLDTGVELGEISLGEKIEMAKMQLRKTIEWKGLPHGIYAFRRHLSVYFKELPEFKQLRLSLLTCEDELELHGLLDQLHQRYLERVGTNETQLVAA